MSCLDCSKALKWNEKFATGCCPLAVYCETCYPAHHLQKCPLCTYKVPDTAGEWADVIDRIHRRSKTVLKTPCLID